MGCPNHPIRASSTGLSSPCLWPHEFPGHLTGKDIGSSQGTAGLCRGVQSQGRSLRGAVRELQQCMAKLMAIYGDDVMEVSLLRQVENESAPSPTPEEETTLLGEGDGPSGAPGPAPQQAKNPRFVEPAEQTTTPVTSTAPHCHPSLKRGKSWEGNDVNPNNTGQWVSIYLKGDSWLLEWWELFQPLTCSVDGCCNDAWGNNMANQQVVAFHLSTTQKEVYGTWLTPPCLSELNRIPWALRPPVDPGLPGSAKGRNHHVGNHTSAVCHMGQSPSRHILWSSPRAPWVSGSIGGGNWPNMEKETWEGVMKDPMVAATWRAPTPKEYPCQCLGWRNPSGLFHQNLHLCLKQKGWHPLRTWLYYQRDSHHHPPGYLPRSQRALPCHPWRMHSCKKPQPFLTSPHWNH